MPTAPVKSKFAFEPTIEAALTNMKIIEEHGFNLENVFKSEPNSTIQPRFEFRDQDIVSKFFDISTDGEKLKNICFKGVDYPFRKDAVMSDEMRIANAEYWLTKGNSTKIRQSFCPNLTWMQPAFAYWSFLNMRCYVE